MGDPSATGGRGGGDRSSPDPGDHGTPPSTPARGEPRDTPTAGAAGLSKG